MPVLRFVLASAALCAASSENTAKFPASYENTTAFPEAMMGVWTPKLGVTPQSILGPLSYEFLAGSAGGFQALRDPATGDVWQ